MVQDTNLACYDKKQYNYFTYVKKMYKLACFFFSLYIFYLQVGVILMFESNVFFFCRFRYRISRLVNKTVLKNKIASISTIC